MPTSPSFGRFYRVRPPAATAGATAGRIFLEAALGIVATLLYIRDRLRRGDKPICESATHVRLGNVTIVLTGTAALYTMALP